MDAAKAKPARRKAALPPRQQRTKGRRPAAGSRDDQFWKAHPGIVWSNPRASDSVMIANALLRGNASTLAEIVKHFGRSRVLRQWRRLKIEADRFPADLRAVHTYGPRIEAILHDLRERRA